METVFVGVDPGKSGAWVMLDSKGFLQTRMITPIVKDSNMVDIKKEFEWLCGICQNTDYKKILTIEDVHPLPGVGAKNTGAFMENKGQIEALFGVMKVLYENIDIVYLAPSKWQKEVWDLKDRVEKPGRCDTKATSLNCAKRIWGNDTFIETPRSKKAHDGIVDAMLIAEASRRIYYKTNV